MIPQSVPQPGLSLLRSNCPYGIYQCGEKDLVEGRTNAEVSTSRLARRLLFDKDVPLDRLSLLVYVHVTLSILWCLWCSNIYTVELIEETSLERIL